MGYYDRTLHNTAPDCFYSKMVNRGSRLSNCVLNSRDFHQLNGSKCTGMIFILFQPWSVVPKSQHFFALLTRIMALPQVAKKRLGWSPKRNENCFWFTSAHYVHPKKMWTLPFLFPVETDREYDKKFDSNCFWIMTASSLLLELGSTLDWPKLLRLHIPKVSSISLDILKVFLRILLFFSSAIA